MTPVALVISAHPDDETIAAGGTLAKLARDGWAVHSVFLTNGPRRPGDENAVREAVEAHSALGLDPPTFLPEFDTVALLDAGTMPVARMGDAVAALELRATLIMAPSARELHAHHRDAAEVAAILARPTETYRPSLLAYEVHRNCWWAGEAFTPSFLVDITDTLEMKLDALACYDAEGQLFPGQRSREAVALEAAWLGARAGVPAAEGFEVIRAFEGGLP